MKRQFRPPYNQPRAPYVDNPHIPPILQDETIINSLFPIFKK